MPEIIQHKIEISALPSQAWRVLSDFPSYSDWNPFIQSISGEFTPGEQINIVLASGRERQKSFNPTLLTVDPEKCLVWLENLYLPGLFDGEHHFEIELISDNKVCFRQFEYFSGLLSGVLLKFIGEQTAAGFESMNLALKKRLESEYLMEAVS